MNQTTFIDKEIILDEKIENIFRMIEAEILKEAFSNAPFTDSPLLSQMKDSLKKCLTKIEDIQSIYLNQEKELLLHEKELRNMGENDKDKRISNKLYEDTILDLNRMKKDISEYHNALKHIIYIEDTASQIKKENEKLLTQWTNQLHGAYNSFIKNNEDLITRLSNLKKIKTN